MKCEVSGCDSERVCFHYCEAHHKEICMAEVTEIEAFDKVFEHPACEPDDDTPYVGEDAERADTAYDQWLHDMGQGA